MRVDRLQTTNIISITAPSEKLRDYPQNGIRNCSETQDVSAGPQAPGWTDVLHELPDRQKMMVLMVLKACVMVVYDVYLRNSENLGGTTVFIDFTLGSVMELPGGIIALITMERLGRKASTVSTLLFTAIGSLVITMMKTEQRYVILGLTLFGRIAMAVCMNVMHQYTIELLPTVARGQGAAVLQTVAKLTTLASPYIVYLDKYGHWIPYTVIFPITLMSTCAAIYLPETLNQKLPDSLADGENFKTHGTNLTAWIGKLRKQPSKSSVEGQANKGFKDDPEVLKSDEIY
ncbi:unnamed protein product, partial [Meganyctiphanes norvegica]